MTSVVAALDSYTPMQVGENSHSEYGWSNNNNEKVVQLFFQLTRCSKDRMVVLATQFKQMLKESILTNNVNMTSLLYKIILQTRDMISGKGEYGLSWHLINVLEKEGLEVMARKMIYYIVHPLPDKLSENEQVNRHPFGSWRDIKYLWSNFEWSATTSNFMLNLINCQLRKDVETISYEYNASISLCGKWVPREKSQFSLMFKELAKNYFSHYIDSANNAKVYSKDRVKRAERKAYSDYRKLLSGLNEHLDTTQVKQCANNYASINYDNVTSVTMNRQRKAFQNINRAGDTRSSEPDRINGAVHFKKWLEDKVDNNETVKGKRVGVNDLVKSAICARHGNLPMNEKTLINSQWADGSNLIGDLSNLIPMCDVSASMECDDALYSAIGLSLRVAEKSKIARGRVMTFTHQPSWITLGTGKYDFVDNVSRIISGPVGYNTNFTAALELILSACLQAKITPDEVGKLTLVIFSDMQIDYHGNESLSTSMWTHIYNRFRQSGYNKVPHILFWNLRSTNGFPSLSSQSGATMFSGFSPTLLNIFCQKGVDGLREMTPYKMLQEVLDNPRYKTFENWN